MSKLKKWLNVREGFVKGIIGLERPKGLLLVGVQGCGKSLAAKALQVPGLFLYFIWMLDRSLRSILGNPKQIYGVLLALRKPCLRVCYGSMNLKAFSMSSDDGGTSHRMLGNLLTWMAENEAPVFIVATANEIDRLPPELLRKGRLDEIFFVDLPRDEVRRDLFTYHLKRRNQSSKASNLQNSFRQVKDSLGRN